MSWLPTAQLLFVASLVVFAHAWPHFRPRSRPNRLAADTSAGKPPKAPDGRGHVDLGGPQADGSLEKALRVIDHSAAFLKDVLPAALTALTIFYLVNPALQKLGPLTVRGVKIANVEFLEHRIHPDGLVENVFGVDVEAIGYEENALLAVESLTLDPATRKRFDGPSTESTVDFHIRTDRAVVRVPVRPTMEYSECVIVQFAVLPVATEGSAPATFFDGAAALAVAETAPFDPDDPSNPACSVSATPMFRDG